MKIFSHYLTRIKKKQTNYNMEHFYQNVGGWFTYLKLYTEAVERQGSKAHFVEVGTSFGKSACYMAVEIINSKKNIRFDCVDSWHGNYKIYMKFLKTIEPIRSMINPIRLPSVEASKLYDDNSLDFVFIDANHTYEFIRDDIKVWYPKVKKGGILAGHDYVLEVCPGVVRAVDEFNAENNYSLDINAEKCWGIIKK